ncbi:hypothetical protein OWM54_42935 [Myxococcus sp. MISCRS1]|uniref:hypothetical protein n=1 Tax=Myxococcus sp. MISCRS1 TaxID=2996786 RepID=UPI00226EAD90|nr:hypothetical protein [Myxococcus sp. MISCRS1]MCY1003921.1 hypothetical protein [Myxococcus sp. MISCRS1]
MAQVSLDNGNTFHDADAVASELATCWDALVEMMDDDVRERVHGELAPCTNVEFLARYLELAKSNLVLG